MIERQVIVTWTCPEEKLPGVGESTVVTFSGKSGNHSYDHTLGVAEYWGGNGWMFDDPNISDDMTVHAWADLEPYEG